MKRQECPGAMSVTQSCCHVGPSISIIDSFNSEKEINQTAKIDECTILAAGHSGALLERAVHPTEALETAYTPYNHCHISPTWTLALLFHWFLKRHLITKNSRYTGLEAEIFGGGGWSHRGQPIPVPPYFLKLWHLCLQPSATSMSVH